MFNNSLIIHRNSNSNIWKTISITKKIMIVPFDESNGTTSVVANFEVKFAHAAEIVAFSAPPWSLQKEGTSIKEKEAV